MFAFILGNHPPLSLAEIQSLFPDIRVIAFEENILITENMNEESVRENFHRMGSIIKVIKLVVPLEGERKSQDELRGCAFGRNEFSSKDVAAYLTSTTEGKIHFGLNIYPSTPPSTSSGSAQGRWNALKKALEIKKHLKAFGRSARVVNKDGNNLSTATTFHEKLVQKGTEVNIVECQVPNTKCQMDEDNLVSGIRNLEPGKKVVLVGITICIQNIESYTRRDIGKSRNMQVGMLPPKLAQIMINLSGASKDTAIYDPFVGLGTILIEAANAGYTNLMGSDISEEMIEKSEKNLEKFKCQMPSTKYQMDKDNLVSGIRNLELFSADATKITNLTHNLTNTTIVTEGYLGRIFNPGNVRPEEVKEEKRKLLEIYRGFFSGLKETDFDGTIVITIPFWQRGNDKIIFTEVYDLFQELGYQIIPLLGDEFSDHLTERGTLLYSRKGQAVGREIYRLR